jgi:hypothetical protein
MLRVMTKNSLPENAGSAVLCWSHHFKHLQHPAGRVFEKEASQLPEQFLPVQFMLVGWRI